MPTNNIYSASGWLPYGVSDDSIIFRTSLTSEASFTTPEIGGAGALTVAAGGNWDAVKGFNPNTGSLFVNNMTNHLTCDDGFQISLQVERSWLCPPNVNLSSGIYAEGDVLVDATDEQMAIQAFNAAGHMYLLLRHISTRTVRMINPDVVLTNPITYADGKDEFVTVNIGYQGGFGGRLFISADDCVIASVIGNDSAIAGTLEDLYIGARAAFNKFMSDHYIRNLQISNRPPSFPMHPKLARIGVISDSLFDSDNVVTSDHRDLQASWTIRRELAKKGLYCGDHLNVADQGAMYVGVHGSHTIQDSGSLDLSTHVPTLLAESPQIVLMRGGTNDIIQGNTIDATWDADLKAFCDSILAGSSVTDLIVGTIPSLVANTSNWTSTDQANLVLANAYINNLPEYDSRISIADNFTDLGENNPIANTFKGQIVGYAAEGADVHCAGLGHYLMGKSYSDAILKIL